MDNDQQRRYDDQQLRLEALRLALGAAEYQPAPNDAANIRATARVFYDFLCGDTEKSQPDG